MEFLPGFGLGAVQYATVALNLALALLAGAGLSQTWLLAASSPWAVRSLRRARRVAIGALALALAASCAVLWLEAAAMAEVALDQAGPAAWSVVSATHRGFAWMLGMGALALAAAALALRGRGSRARARGADMAGLLAVAIFLYSRSIVSHAASGGDAGWAVLADWLHLVFISMWVGDVFVAGLAVLPLAPGSVGHARHEAARYIGALSRSATVALAGIVVTGLLGAWRSLGSVDNITGNPYADILLAKLVLVAAAAVLGGVNRFFVMPGLLARLRGSGPATGDARRFTAILQFEALILFAALVLAAVLSSTAPPGAG